MVVTMGPASMVTFSMWNDDTAANLTIGEENYDESFVTVEDPIGGDEGMLADFLAGHRACYADEDGGAPLADGLADHANQIWAKGREGRAMQRTKDGLARYPRPENLER